VNEQGKLEGLKVVRSVLPDIDRSVLAAVTQWEFSPAQRSNSPVMVEVLLSIPAAGI
jgi:TonB family protein